MRCDAGGHQLTEAATGLRFIPATEVHGKQTRRTQNCVIVGPLVTTHLVWQAVHVIDHTAKMAASAMLTL